MSLFCILNILMLLFKYIWFTLYSYVFYALKNITVRRHHKLYLSAKGFMHKTIRDSYNKNLGAFFPLWKLCYLQYKFFLFF